MSNSLIQLKKYAIPIIAVMVIIVHFVLVKTSNLNRWKGGGFGMYSEVHYYYNEVYISDLSQPLNSLIAEDKFIKHVIMDVKRMPNKSNLENMAKIISKYVASDTISIQVWKPLVNSKNASYSRKLVNQFQYIKP
jgi:hypothetical protein